MLKHHKWLILRRRLHSCQISCTLTTCMLLDGGYVIQPEWSRRRRHGQLVQKTAHGCSVIDVRQNGSHRVSQCTVLISRYVRQNR
ncbi:hypothetical protein CC85DRAFT_191914 [Cutaneotrichosporon oleaginosum]|uniref:Uncharacterized protein n=1 Tax=Cutaneotrichosporon oleaginosum TaxID=879819 RepID=A0A0J1AW77_9TREE|nr:uncharacterized protein CC85DRAFT_191914 [Cutaneotrichosporon oleaginosum]KLT39534.1 hypothetical protein CC85DRAFT_191914 [Cutaneotrichosporon oleaginosum]TXT07067.1 hypothetical protein COLE_06398 [Cutaneotrichosporon oleaginosum]